MPKPKIGSVYRRKKRNRNGRMVELPTWWIKYSKDGRIFRESSKSKSRVDAERLTQQPREVAGRRRGAPHARRHHLRSAIELGEGGRRVHERAHQIRQASGAG